MYHLIRKGLFLLYYLVCTRREVRNPIINASLPFRQLIDEIVKPVITVLKNENNHHYIILKLHNMIEDGRQIWFHTACALNAFPAERVDKSETLSAVRSVMSVCQQIKKTPHCLTLVFHSQSIWRTRPAFFLFSLFFFSY